MPKLTLYIFTCGEDFDPKNAIRSVPTSEDDRISIRENRDLSGEKFETDWVGFLMANEMLDEKLSIALSVFLESNFECLTLFKKTVDHYCCTPVDHYFYTPRFFRNKVRFGSENLLPLNIGELNSTRVLNGLIIDAPNGINGKTR